MIRKTIRALLALLAIPATAQDFAYPLSGQCPETHLKYQGVCIRAKLLDEQDSGTVIRQLMEFKSKNRPPVESVASFSACQTKIDEDKDDILKLDNGAVVEILSGYLGYVGYRKDALIFQDRNGWKIWVEGKSVFPVEVFREPETCRRPSSHLIEATVNDDIFIINGEKFQAKVYCLGWSEGESVIFIDGSEYGACSSARIINIERAESCDVWCE